MSQFRSAALAATVAATGLGLAFASPAQAQTVREDAGRDARRTTVSGFAMVLTEVRLPRLPYELITFQLPINDSYLASAAVNRTVVPRFDVPLGLFSLKGNSLELEAQVLKHFENQNNVELAGAAVLRTGQAGLFGGLSINGAWGNGFSYALGNPRNEFGRGGIRGVDTVKFQYHMSFEGELTDSSNPRLHYVLRLHHRSGIYGLISPSRTGSNYIGVGLRFDVDRR